MFSLSVQHGMLHDWVKNWIKPLHEGEDAYYLSNYYCTIMVDSIKESFFGSKYGNENKWMGKINNKHAHGQASFCKAHNSFDHLVTFYVLMEESKC